MTERINPYLPKEYVERLRNNGMIGVTEVVMFVDPTVEDDSGDGSRDRPFKTLDRALNSNGHSIHGGLTVIRTSED